jgi:hypothetical protein
MVIQVIEKTALSPITYKIKLYKCYINKNLNFQGTNF